MPVLVNASSPDPDSSTHVNDPAERPNGIWSIDCVCSTTSILHDGACDHNNILCRMRQLLNDKVDHLP